MKVLNDEYDKLTKKNGNSTVIAQAIEKVKKNVDDKGGSGGGSR